MAGDWIKMRIDLPDDPNVFKLSALTKLDRLSIVGRLYAFWSWADKHAVDGRVDGASSILVDDIARHDGFAGALVSVNWLVIGEDYVAIPNHERHNGESAKERGLKNARQARWRKGNSDKNTDVDGVASTHASTEASTREEKRREENTKSPAGKKPADVLGVSDLEALGVEKQVAKDWLTIRKQKKCPLTPTAMEEFTTNVQKAGMTVPNAIRLCCGRGWAGFNAKWLDKDEPGAGTPQRRMEDVI